MKTKKELVDHLFRHQYGKMVAILTKIFGFEHLHLIEDAVQDTFHKAILKWRTEIPPNPQAWLTLAAKRRTIDIFRKIKSDNKRDVLTSGPATIAILEAFNSKEIADSQLRMIFMACHPALKPQDQISFALKTISGFSIKEIANALLCKDETIKKRLMRARKMILNENIKFEIPTGTDLKNRLSRVHEVLYLIFNEGYQSNNKDVLVSQELCFEAMRLCRLIIDQNLNKKNETLALFALMCFHAARMDSKLDDNNRFVNLRDQDRTKWDSQLILLGNYNMSLAVESTNYSPYHYEAAIAAEHLKVDSFVKTNWKKISEWYSRLYELSPNDNILLNMAIVELQRKNYVKTVKILQQIKVKELQSRSYLYYATQYEYYLQKENILLAKSNLQSAIDLVHNETEKMYYLEKMNELSPSKTS